MIESAVAGHYGSGGLRNRIFAALEAAGLDPARLTTADLAPVDEFHMGGRAATTDIVARAGLSAGDRVLDIGSGLGGLVRHLAGSLGCRATGLDLTPEYVALAREFTQATGLSDRADFVTGSALDLPFDDASFDAALTFHVGMNISDRPRKYAEAARVLRPGGTFVIYDVIKGPQPGMRFPVPWADSEETSFLLTAEEQSARVTGAGFTVIVDEDRTPMVLAHHRKALAQITAGGPRPLGLHLLQGENAAQKSRNMIEMAEAGQIGLRLLIARRDPALG